MSGKKIALISVLTVVIYIYMRSGITFVPVEEINLPSGVSMDMELDETDKLKYVISMSVFNFGTKPMITSIEYPGSANTLGDTRQTRQVKMDKKFILGLEKIILASQDAARFGIEPWINILFANPNVNDTGYFIICSGKARELLAVKVPGYPSSSDYIDGMIRHCVEYNFFADKYKLLDLYITLASEGKKLVVPYVEFENNNLKISGMAVFNKDKFVRKLDMSDTRVMNLLRENNVKGMINIQKSPKEYVNFYATSKRKVKCKKTGKDKYSFEIELSLNGSLASNLLYEDIYDKPEVAKRFENDMSKTVESMCNKFIDKMQNEYRLDLLQLGEYAVAKDGRNKYVNWDEVISNSEIKVKVKTKLDLLSRGDYNIEKDK